MKPPSQRPIRVGVIRLISYANDLFRIPIRINTGFLTVTRAVKVQLSRLSSGQAPRGDLRKAYENREGFPRYSHRIHAIFTPSPPLYQVDGRAFVHSGIKSNSQWHNQTRFIIFIAFALLITLCGCGKWNARNPMVPIGPTLTVGTVFTLPGNIQAMAARGNLLYVCLRPSSPDSNSALFYVVDASDLANPKVIGSALDHGQYSYVYGLALFGSYAYVNTYSKGLVVLDISNPTAPMVLASYDTLATIPKGVSGSHLYGIGYGLEYLSLSDPVHPKREGRLINASVSSLAVPWDETRCAFVSFETNRICMADFTNPTSPRIVAYSSPTSLYGIAFCAGSLFEVTGERSPAILRFSWEGSDSIYQTGKADLPVSAFCLAVLGNRIVVGISSFISYGPRVFLLSATGPQSPYMVGEWCTLPFAPLQLTAEGNRIYADLGRGYLAAVEVTEH